MLGYVPTGWAGRPLDAVKADIDRYRQWYGVEGVFLDVDGDHHVAVTLDDDPAADLHQEQGRFMYFHPDEVEPRP